MIQSLSRTLHEEVTFDRAHVTSRDWQGYPILRFEEIPDRIDVVMVNNRPEYPSLGCRRAFDLSDGGGHQQRRLSMRSACGCGRRRSVPSGSRRC